MIAEQETLFNALYKGFTIEMNSRFHNVDVDTHLHQFSYFRISNNVFVFSDENRHTEATEYYDGMLVGENNTLLAITKNMKFFKYLFPFMKFRRDQFGFMKSGWHDMNLVLSRLPTRKNIINTLLTEL